MKDVSLILNVARRSGLLTGAQADQCREALNAASDPYGWIQRNGLLDDAEVRTLESFVLRLEQDQAVIESLTETGSLQSGQAIQLRDRQLDSLGTKKLVSLEEVGQILKLPIQEELAELRKDFRFGPYRILRELGRGGMGIVYAARDVRLGRDVAIKVLREGFAQRDRARFLREAEVTARLHHPGIVPVFDIGGEDAVPYLVMDLIEGENLAAARLTRREALGVMQTVADAVHFANEAGVLHRDIKPANILVDRERKGYITDFGLAKHVLTAEAMTATGELFRTPHFMSPEQARGDVENVDRRSDVWGLGSTLYFVLTGNPPFQGTTPFAVIKNLLQADPIPPRKLDSRVHRDAATICMKALEKEAERRYQTAGELAGDLRHHLDGEPISVHPPSTAYRVKRWMKRHRVRLAGMLGILLVGCVSGLIISWVNRNHSFQEAKGTAESAFSSGDWSAAFAASERALAIRSDARLESIRKRSRAELAAKNAQRRRVLWLQRELKPMEGIIKSSRTFLYIPGADFRERCERVRRALRLLDSFLRDSRNVNYPEVWAMIGLGAYLLGDRTRAYDSLSRSLELGYHESWAYFVRGKAAFELHIIEAWPQDLEKDREWRGRAIKSFQSLESHAQMGKDLEKFLARTFLLYLKGSKKEMALRCVEGLRSFGNRMGTEDFLLLQALAKGSALAPDVTSVIVRKPHAAFPYFVRGTLLLDAGQLDGAESDFRRAIEISPDKSILRARAQKRLQDLNRGR